MFGGNVTKPTIEQAQARLEEARASRDAGAIELATQYLNILNFINTHNLEEERHINPELLRQFRDLIDAAAAVAVTVDEDGSFLARTADVLDEAVNFANNIVSRFNVDRTETHAPPIHPPPSAAASARAAFERADDAAAARADASALRAYAGRPSPPGDPSGGPSPPPPVRPPPPSARGAPSARGDLYYDYSFNSIVD